MVTSMVRITLVTICATLTCAQVAAGAAGARSRIVTGTVIDSSSMKPVPQVTVQLVGTGRSTLTNDDGRYRLFIDSGVNQLRFSHVAFFPYVVSVPPQDTLVTLGAYLHPSLIEIKGMTVYEKAYDVAQQIMVEAIARKKQMLRELQAYRLKAYVKGLARDRSKPDSLAILGILESQLRYDWEYPNKHKSLVEMNHRTANLSDDWYVGLEDVTSVYQDRISLGILEAVSPMADDALDFYTYRLDDSVIVDGQRAFVLSFVPRKENQPLFVGTLQIADSSYALIASELRGTKAFHVSVIENLWMREHYVLYLQKFAMPSESRIGYDFILGVPVPGLPSKMSVEAVVSMQDYEFTKDTTGKVFDEYVEEVAPGADKFDSVKWAARQTIPLTAQEQRSYIRYDSIKHAPKPLGPKISLAILGRVFSPSGSNSFRFNRAEGAYVGLGESIEKLIPRMELFLSSGYAIDGQVWEHEYTARYAITQKRNIACFFGFSNHFAKRRTVLSSPSSDMTFFALLDKYDFFDYFRERGFTVQLSGRILRHVNGRAGFQSYRQWSAPIASSYSVFRHDDAARENPQIADGDLHAVTYRLEYDSRPLALIKGREYRQYREQRLSADLAVKYANRKLLGGDFDFRRYLVTLQFTSPVLGLGSTSLFAVGGTSDDALPPQENFIVDYGKPILGRSLGFVTMGEHNFEGDRVLAVYARHEFRALLFAKSGLPLIRKIPLFLSVYGGAFWSDFHYRESKVVGRTVNVAERPYSELGFGLGNLTPFLRAFNLELDFTWQLSHYHTNRFAVDVTLGL